LTHISFAGKLLAPEFQVKVDHSLSHQYPESFVFYRQLNRQYPRIVRGDGIYIFDENGKQYLDGVGGAMVANIGHGVSEIADAVTDQMREVAYVNGMMFGGSSAPAVEV
jgi:adenosylmethionine-8-amino-7-oxononanoate aminotransferase